MVKRKKIIHNSSKEGAGTTTRTLSIWIIIASILAIIGIVVGTVALSQINNPTSTPPGLLSVTDYQVIVVSNFNLIPQPGDVDIITIVITNNDIVPILNITVTNELDVVLSVKRKRSIVVNTVICAATNYTTNIIPVLNPGQSTSCKTSYTLTVGDISGLAILSSNSTAFSILLVGNGVSSINLASVPPDNIILSAGSGERSDSPGFVNGLCPGNFPHNTTTCFTNWTFFCDDTGSVFVCENGTWTATSSTLFGKNSFTTTVASFVQPPANTNVNVSVNSSYWMVSGQVVFVANGGGYYLVQHVLNETAVTLLNLQYNSNAAPGSTIVSFSSVSPGGVSGPSAEPVMGGNGFETGYCSMGVPSPPCPGNNNSYANWTFFCNNNGDVFVCVGNAWENKANLQGSSGATGTRGTIGITGNMGASGASGGIGSTGTTGATGGTGGSGTNGETGVTGSSGSVGGTGGYGLSGTSGGTGGLGVTGGTGSTGGVGLIGSTGTDGATGSIGTSGGTGGSGETGTLGSSGTTGTTGTSGHTGGTGSSGSTGTSGGIGTSGAIGALGGTGSTGADGETGTIGSSGSTGGTGVTGGSGGSGESGSIGTIGASGAIGFSGVSGTTGSTGIIGDNGVTGSTGTSGSTGSSGSTGVSGTIGTTGSTGETGVSGSTGATGPSGGTGAIGTDYPDSFVVAAGLGINTLAYSLDGSTFLPANTSCFTERGYEVAYSPFLRIWVAVGQGTNTICVSYDGIRWRGLGLIFSSFGFSVYWSESRKVFIAGGLGGANPMYRSYNGIVWYGIGSSAFNARVNDVRYSAETGRWVAVGCCTNHIAYSNNDGATWTNVGLISGVDTVSEGVYDVDYNPSQGRWIFASAPNNFTTGTLTAYSDDNAVSWTILPNVAPFNPNCGQAFGVTFANGTWMLGGSYAINVSGAVLQASLTGNSLFTQPAGANAGFVSTSDRRFIRTIAYNSLIGRWYFGGFSSNNTISYSDDNGITATHLGNSIFSAQTLGFGFPHDTESVPSKSKKRSLLVEYLSNLRKEKYVT